MSKHTPGPWEVRGDSVNVVLTGNNVCDLYCNPSDANARLIAAAPDMYEACLAVIQWWEDHKYDTVPDGEGDESNMYDNEPAMVSLAKAAIAKAGGTK